uniref:Ubiquitin-like domain-containing protein n=1 Tax=Pyramimonas obovata TaxID=1411642 RepID=A0A7S0WIM9_9CHLO|mmetsp:Transcript_26407/g.57349  ORF Transcript_26407/g.57349 Transcript_26407/m.57349 type:complete len:290 (+) Transcript_26407:104-973(+)
MGKHRVKPVYFLPILLRAHEGSSPDEDIELTIAGVRQKDKIDTIKELIELKYGIPKDHQTLRGPMPSKEILKDHFSLRKSRIVLGRVTLPGASRMDPDLYGLDDENEDDSYTTEATADYDRSLATHAESTSGRPVPGMLFCTGGAFARRPSKTIRMGEEGSAGVGSTVDTVQLVTKLPPSHYEQGGEFYLAQQRRQRLQIFWWIVIALLLLCGMVYVWWTVPYYKLPEPQHWLEGVETRMKQSVLKRRLEEAGVDLAQYGIPAHNEGEDSEEDETVLHFLYERFIRPEL